MSRVDTIHVGGRSHPVETPETHPHLFRAMPTPSHFGDVPDAFDWSQLSTGEQGKAFLNDFLGDCLFAGKLHLNAAVTSFAGAPVTWSDDDALRLYRTEGGYDGSPASDRGSDEITSLAGWRDNGLGADGSHKIDSWMMVNAARIDEFAFACYAFGGVYCVADLPDACLAVDGTGFTWDAGPANPRNGHCFVILGRAARGAWVVSSWGKLGIATDAFVTSLLVRDAGGGAFVVLTKDIINIASTLSPTGLDWSALQADLALVSGASNV